MIRDVSDEQAMMVLGGEFASICQAPCCVFLRGVLGAGKTTFTRGFLRAKGHEGVVPSPSYQLVQIYDLPSVAVVHIDLYRLAGAADFESLGIMEWVDRAVLMIEWPEHGADQWVMPDIMCHFSILANRHEVEIVSISDRGRNLLQAKSYSE